ncbi:hypothetical protein [Komagataeibacter saccharivorans]|uniref:hypothetical protein n=1 Tax=Komagataeibacter saccharivorans TaxID=265959 RepID=UPI00215593EF|nr:hypothetical protein [Komagataeibacter saccharivorans]
MPSVRSQPPCVPFDYPCQQDNHINFSIRTLDTIQTTISTNIATYLNGLAIGDAASYSRLIQIAYASSTSVSNVTGVTLAGGVADLPATTGTAYRSGTVDFG